MEDEDGENVELSDADDLITDTIEPDENNEIDISEFEE